MNTLKRFAALFAAFFVILAVARPALADEAPDGKQDDAEEHHTGPVTMHVGLSLEKLNKFEVGPGTVNAEFYVAIHCSAEPCKPDFDVTNGKITGKEKISDEKMDKEWRVKAELDALVDLAAFPFDSHVLYIGLADKGDPVNVTYVVDEEKSTVDPDIKLAGWTIDSKFEVDTETHKLGEGREIHEVLLGVGIKRPMVSAFFKSFVPVLFMVFVAGFTLLLKPKSATGRLTTATGGLMSVVMFHLSATSSLPPMGYLTLLDKFMLATYVIYVVNIALSVAMVRFEEKKKERQSELTYLIAAGAVPGVALIAWVAVFMQIV